MGVPDPAPLSLKESFNSVCMDCNSMKNMIKEGRDVLCIGDFARLAGNMMEFFVMDVRQKIDNFAIDSAEQYIEVMQQIDEAADENKMNEIKKLLPQAENALCGIISAWGNSVFETVRSYEK